MGERDVVKDLEHPFFRHAQILKDWLTFFDLSIITFKGKQYVRQTNGIERMNMELGCSGN